MGAFFTNTQVKLKSSADRSELLGDLGAAVERQGFVASEAPADRCVIVGPRREGGWFAIWDEATEDQGGELQREVAEALAAAHEAAVSVLVHDSDALHMELFREGQRATLQHGIDLATGGTLRTPPAHLDAWLSFLEDEPARGRLKVALETQAVFAEGALAEIGVALGWHAQDPATGFRYLEEHSHLATDEAIALHFRAAERPAHESSAQGPPSYMAQGYQPKLEAKMGARLEVHQSASSMGGPSQGLTVTLDGPAITDRLFVPRQVLLRWGTELPFDELLASVEESAGVAVARFPDFEVPAGMVDPYGAMRAGGFSRKAHQAFQARHVHVFVRGRAKRAGDAELRVTIAPTAAPGDGAAHFAMRLTVSGR